MSSLINPESDHQFKEEELEWIGAHLSELRQTVAEGRIRTATLWTGFGVGLVVHAVGFLLKTSVTGEPIGVLADLLYTLGWALWTGVVVVALVEIIPKAKERQITRTLDAYEKTLRAQARTKGTGAGRA